MIDLTPLDVRNKRGDFRKNLRGYDAQEVDTFLELVAERLEELVMENLRLRERTDALQSQVESQSGREQAVQEALVTAQKLRSEMREQAEREADVVLAEARAEGRRLQAEAEAEARTLLRDAERRLQEATLGLEELERRRLRFLKSYRQLLEREMDVVQVEEERAPLEDTPIELDLLGGFSGSAEMPGAGEASGEKGAGAARPIRTEEEAEDAEPALGGEAATSGSEGEGPGAGLPVGDSGPVAREEEEPRKPGAAGFEELSPAPSPAPGTEPQRDPEPASPAEEPAGGTPPEADPRRPSGKPTPAQVAREALAAAGGGEVGGDDPRQRAEGVVDGPGPTVEAGRDAAPAAGEVGGPGAHPEPAGQRAVEALGQESPEPLQAAPGERSDRDVPPTEPERAPDEPIRPREMPEAEGGHDDAREGTAATVPEHPTSSGPGSTTGPADQDDVPGKARPPGGEDPWQARVFSADEAADDVRELIERLDAIRGLVEADGGDGGSGSGEPPRDPGPAPSGEGPGSGDGPPPGDEGRREEEGRWG